MADWNSIYQQLIAAKIPPDEAKAMADAAVATASGNANDPDVFWSIKGGPTTPYVDVAGPGGQVKRRAGDTDLASHPLTMKASQANYWLQQQFIDQSPDWKRIVSEMQTAGLISPGADLADILSQWEKAVALSAASTPNGATLSPEDYIKLQGALSTGGGGALHTTVSTSVDRTPTADLIGNAQTQAQVDLGRRLSGAEAQARADALSALESSNPRTTTTTSVTDALGTLRKQSSVTEGGLGAAGMQEALTQQDMASKDYGAYQAAGHYFPLLLQALGGVNQAGT